MLVMHENHTVVEREQKTLKCFKFAVLHTEHCTRIELNVIYCFEFFVQTLASSNRVNLRIVPFE